MNNEEIDAVYAKRIKDNAMTGDNEEDHFTADRLLCDLLKVLGCNQTVEAYKKVGKWYA